MTIHRTILKQELTMKLYPNSISVKLAMQQLSREIDICPALKEWITPAGKSAYSKTSTTELSEIENKNNRFFTKKKIVHRYYKLFG